MAPTTRILLRIGVSPWSPRIVEYAPHGVHPVPWSGRDGDRLPVPRPARLGPRPRRRGALPGPEGAQAPEPRGVAVRARGPLRRGPDARPHRPHRGAPAPRAGRVRRPRPLHGRVARPRRAPPARLGEAPGGRGPLREQEGVLEARAERAAALH